MYKKLKLDNQNGWTEISRQTELKGLSTNGSNEYVFYVGEMPKSIEDQNAIIEEVFKINKNKINRVTIGVKHTIMSEGPRSCGHGCWCVQETNGSRHCETCYCNGNGYCWCVNCSGSC